MTFRQFAIAPRFSHVPPVEPVTVPQLVQGQTSEHQQDLASNQDLKVKTARSGAITLIAQGLRVVLRIGSMMVMARLLAPEDFGLQGMVLAVTGFVNLFKDAGLGLATVQQDAITHEQTSTLFWINASLGALLGSVLVVASPALAAFYGEPRLRSIAVVSALAFIVNGLGVQHQALLQRELRFATVGIIDIVSILVGAVVGLSMANAGYGYWALVAMTVTTPATATAGCWLAVRWVPGLPHRGVGLKSMLHLGGTWTFVGLASYVSYNIEKVLLGRYWGAIPLGLYGRAYQLISLPTELMNSVGTVAVSALSRLQQDPAKLRRAFTACYSLVVSLTIPVTFISALAAEEIVAVLLGPQWKESAAILRRLAPTTLAFALMCPWAWILVATARNRVSIGTTLLVPPAVISGILLGLQNGPRGVAIGYSAGVSLVAIPVIIWCRAASGVPFTDLWDAVRRPIASGVLAAVCTAAVKSRLAGTAPLLTLVVETMAFFAVYAFVLLMVFGRLAYYLDLTKSVFSRPKAPAQAQAPSSLAVAAESSSVVG